MTSHHRHRRSAVATDPLPPQMESGEIAVNTANRQIAVGNPQGAPLALLAVRYFDVNAKYAAGDFVVQAGKLYFSKEAIAPGPFDPTKWSVASNDPDDVTDLSNYVQKSGSTMTGALVLAADPQADLEAATKIYVDNSTPPPPVAAEIAVTPVGEVQATNVQTAIAELDAEKVSISGETMIGLLTLSGAPTDDLHASTKLYTDTTATTAANTAANTRVSKAGDTMVGALTVNADIFAARTPNSGVIFLGTNQAHYLFFDGSNYNMPAGGLGVGGALSAVQGNFGGVVTVNAGLTAPMGQPVTINTAGSFASEGPSNFLVQGGYPTISFHLPGYFGANFGMNTDGNFYIGGWSFGANNYYRVITTREGVPVTSHRMVHVGDFTHTYFQVGWGVTEPFGRNASVTGMGAPNSTGTYSEIIARYAQHQILVNGGWVAVGGA